MIAEKSPWEWALTPLKKYGEFSGRAPRAEYWWFYLGTIVVGLVTEILDGSLASDDIGWLSLVVNVALIVPTIAVTVRRLHDTERTGWWLLAPIVPAIVIGVGAVGLLESSIDAVMPTAPVLISAVAFLVACITLLVFMVLPGTDGPNRYGADPYRPDEHLEEIFA